MSETFFATAFGWYPGFAAKVRAVIEAEKRDLEADATNLEPEVQKLLVAAGEAGAKAALASTGTIDERAAAGLAAALDVGKTQGVDLDEELVKAAIQGEADAMSALQEAPVPGATLEPAPGDAPAGAPASIEPQA